MTNTPIISLPTRLRARRKLLPANDGVTSLEFAMIAPVFIVIIMGIIEFSIIQFTQAMMESATSNTARMGATGYTAPGVTRQDQLINNVRSRTSDLLNADLLTVTTNTYASFSDVNDPEPYIDTNGNGMYSSGEPYTDVNGNGQWDEDMARAGAGSANDIVVYTVSYPWRIMTPIIGTILGSTYTINARMVVKNEPW